MIIFKIFSQLICNTAWKDFYIDDEQEPQIEQLILNSSSTEHRSITSGNAYIHKSLFSLIKVPDFGGGIYYYVSDNFKLLIEDSQFVECTAIKSGAGTYAYLGQFVFYRVCGNNCTTQSSGLDLDGTFCNTYSSQKTHKNYAILTQISYCQNEAYGYTVSIMERALPNTLTCQTIFVEK